jgi:hypothetical protein
MVTVEIGVGNSRRAGVWKCGDVVVGGGGGGQGGLEVSFVVTTPD